jgi:hypothetical protein
MSADQKQELLKKENLPLNKLEWLNLSYNKIGPKLAPILFSHQFGLVSN